MSTGSGSFIIPTAVVGLILFSLIYTLFGNGAQAEALILGFLLFGYVVGNRGFAALALSSTAPLYVGEVGMSACFILFLFRMAFTKGRFIPPNAIGWTVAVLILIGSARFALDLDETHPKQLGDIKDILRDFAMVYYASVFFIAYSIGQHEKSRRFIEKALLWAFILLIPSFGLQTFFPDIYDPLSVRGMPIIYHKGDLACAFLAVGTIFLYVRGERSRFRWVWIVLSMLSFCLIFAGGLSRAALVGLIIANGFLLLAKRGKIAKYQMLYAAVGGIALLGVSLISGHKDDDSMLLQMAEKAATIVDVSGNYHYSLSSSESSVQNTRFRKAWWSCVYDETMEKSPVFGLGFGYDLTARFLQTYDVPLGEEFDARSPHSILFSIFGRMGFVGLLSFVAILLQIVLLGFRYAWALRGTSMFNYGLALWTGLIIILITACFGVVLEGPMAAIPFWTFLGLIMSEKGPKPDRTQQNGQKHPEYGTLRPIPLMHARLSDKQPGYSRARLR